MRLIFAVCWALLFPTLGLGAERVVDIPTRPGVTQRMLVITPEHPKASVVLFAGGHGGLRIADDGTIRWGKRNFLVRTRQMFADRGLTVAVVDAPSDRQGPPYLDRFRETPEHVVDIKAVIAWLRQQANVPVWLVGTSRGTLSAAYVTTQLTGADGPDGLVLTSTILTDHWATPVPQMELGNIRVPVLVIHHEHDGCIVCQPGYLPRLMSRLTAAPRKELITVSGGADEGDPCEAMSHHGFNGIEQEVVSRATDWILK